MKYYLSVYCRENSFGRGQDLKKVVSITSKVRNSPLSLEENMCDDGIDLPNIYTN